MSTQTTRYYYEGILVFMSLYWAQSYWLTLILTLLHLSWIAYNLFKSPKVKGKS